MLAPDKEVGDDEADRARAVVVRLRLWLRRRRTRVATEAVMPKPGRRPGFGMLA